MWDQENDLDSLLFLFRYLLKLVPRGGIRTTDTAIFSRMLYQLSYLGAAVRTPAYRYGCRPCPARGAMVVKCSLRIPRPGLGEGG